VSASLAGSPVPADTSFSSGRCSRSACSDYSPPSSRCADCGACHGAGPGQPRVLLPRRSLSLRRRLENCSRKSRSFARCWALSWCSSLPWVARFICIGSLAARRDRRRSSLWLSSDRPLWLPVCNSFFLKCSPRCDAIERHYWRERRYATNSQGNLTRRCSDSRTVGQIPQVSSAKINQPVRHSFASNRDG